MTRAHLPDTSSVRVRYLDERSMRRNRASASNPGVNVTTPGTTPFDHLCATRVRRLHRTSATCTSAERPARSLGDANSAEDLLQCALVRVLPHWSAIREPSAADAYIRRAMRNQHASWYRQKWRSQERSFADVPDLEPSWDRYPGTDAALWPLVAALPPAQRSAVALRYYEGLSVAEASRALGCSPGTVKSNTSRGLASLRRSITESDVQHDLAS